MTKYIFVTGGVVSGLGKGITAASLGRLLKARGLKVAAQKLDPYINVDPGTMSPYQHGEVYVTEDGAETDLDLGHYERCIDEDLNQRLGELLGCEGADVVIECVGNPRTSAQAIDAAARCGRILLFGVPNPEAVLQTRMHPIFQKELTIMGSFVNPDTHSRAVALLASGQLKLKPLITHRYPISQLEDAIMTQTSDKSIKVLVKAEV